MRAQPLRLTITPSLWRIAATTLLSLWLASCAGLGGAASPPSYLRVDAAGWPEGDYLIRFDAIPSAPLACGPAESCAPPTGIDGFLLQVRAEAEAADLCLRADLACLAQDQASV